MRRVEWMLVVLALAAMAVTGCSKESGPNDEGGPQGEQPSEEPAAAKGGMEGMTLDLPDGWTAYPEEGRTDFWTRKGQHFSLWTEPAGRTEQEAVTNVAETILPVVKEFVVDSEEDAEVAGVPARHLFGKGVEADDGDDSIAEVYVFTLGDRVRVACIHGEGDAAETLRPTALAILGTAKAE